MKILKDYVFRLYPNKNQEVDYQNEEIKDLKVKVFIIKKEI